MTNFSELPLVFFTVLSQMAVGAFILLYFLEKKSHISEAAANCVAKLVFVLMVLAMGGASTHLGDPMGGVRALLGLITGTACGCSRKVDYWVAPFMKLLGAIPSPTWIPIVMVIASSLFTGSVFIISLGVWYSLTIDAAQTLGACRTQLVFRVALPFAVPNILQGLTQGMSSACMALITAEMVGVESGLGWYVSWQKSWAQYGKMYAAIVVLCVVFVAVNWGLNRIKRYLLRWQEGALQ